MDPKKTKKVEKYQGGKCVHRWEQRAGETWVAIM